MRQRIEITADCWIWTGRLQAQGYGVLDVGPASYLAHRLAYELWVGPVPTAYHVHHRCETPACVNPAHLEAMDPSEHLSEHRAPGGYCRNGHPITEGNVTEWTDGRKRCLTCIRLRKLGLR